MQKNNVLVGFLSIQLTLMIVQVNRVIKENFQ